MPNSNAMATSSAITLTKKEEDEPKPAEETLMMASTSDMNSAIKLAVEEALKNGAKLNKSEIKSLYTIYIPHMEKLRDPRKPRSRLELS